MTIIASSLIAGVVAFGAFATLNRPDQPQTSMMTMVLIAMVVMEAGAFVIAPGLMVRKAIAELDHEGEDDESLKLKLAGIFQTRMIIRMALCEGAAFFACIVWMIEGNYIALGILLGLVLIQLILFPTRNTLENWIDEQLNLIRAV